MRALFLLLCLLGLTAASPTIAWWDVPRRGGNSFNRLPPDQAWFDALAGHQADWVRLTFTKWKGEGRDFLIGDTDRYTGLNEEDLATLIAVLDRAERAGLKVVIAPLSLPMERWSQQNNGKPDGRLWRDKANWAVAARFWSDLAARLRDHPAVAAYNILNEPTPERGSGLTEHAPAADQQAWYGKHRGTARDLPDFYRKVIAAIRAVDPDTPIMLDAGWYAAADAFAYWPGPLEDPALLYAFHMYEPYEATSAPNLKRNPPFTYPGRAPFAGTPGQWDASRVAAYLGQPIAWADAHGAPRNRMVAAEFGCMRRLPFCPVYLEDVLAVLEDARVHWAFYAFREDAWDGMDYELGTAPVNWRYWEAEEKGLRDPVARDPDAETFAPIRRRLQGNKR